MKAIETRWKGYRFRSRLEARWAVYFDAIGLKWEYEPEGFDLGDGICYLPDFWLPQVNMWGEVKPVKFTGLEREKARRLAAQSGYPVIMLIGAPAPIAYWVLSGLDDEEFAVGYLDEYDVILDTLYLHENRFFAATGYAESEEIDLDFHRDVYRAVETSRAARFEFADRYVGL